MFFFLGVDIGATKSHALIVDENGQAIGFGTAGSGNYEFVGWDGLEKALREATSQALHEAGLSRDQLSGAGFGIAGYDWPSERKPTLKAIETLNLKCPFEVVNDTIIGIKAGSAQGWGIGIVAGTGENCWGVDKDMRFGRMTGNSIYMDEYGGAGTIVCKAIREISRQWGMRGPVTALSEIFMEYTDAANLDDFLELVAMDRQYVRARAAPLVFRAAKNGDGVAIEIIHWAAHGLADMVLGVVRQLDFDDIEFEVIMIGSTFNGGPLLIDPFKKTVLAAAPGAKFVSLTVPPVIGGVLLGMENIGVNGYNLRSKIEKSTLKLMQVFP